MNKPVAQIFAVFLKILVRKHKTPRNTLSRHLRFVGENSLQTAAEPVVIRLINSFYKLGNHVFVQRVNVKRVYFIIKMITVPVADCVLGLFFALLHSEVFLLIFYTQSVYNSSAESARPAVFVVCPRIHSALLRLRHADFYVFKPFVAHILGQKSAPCVHKISAEARLVHKVNLTRGFGFVKFFVPRPKRHGTVFFRRIFKHFAGYFRHNFSLVYIKFSS